MLPFQCRLNSIQHPGNSILSAVKTSGNEKLNTELLANSELAWSELHLSAVTGIYVPMVDALRLIPFRLTGSINCSSLKQKQLIWVGENTTCRTLYTSKRWETSFPSWVISWLNQVSLSFLSSRCLLCPLSCFGARCKPCAQTRRNWNSVVLLSSFSPVPTL